MLLRSLYVVLASATTVLGAGIQLVKDDWGTHPAKELMYTYVPTKLATKPAIIVALHGCLSDAVTFSTSGKPGGSWFPYADKLGFVMIYAGTTDQSNCWDVHNPATLTHGAGGDSAGIVNMVNWALKKYDGDASKVFVFGSSSGAMMTNVLAAVYPDVFEAGAAFSGVAHACFAGAAGSTPLSANQTCAQGLSHTGTEWANFVHNSYPGYTGKRTRLQIWHGLADTLVYPKAGYEAMKQWSTFLEQPSTKNNTGVPSAAYTQMMYGDGSKLQGYTATGIGHTVPIGGHEENVLKFFGLMT